MTTENTSSMTLDEAFQLGVTLYQQGNRQDARDLFEQILSQAADAVPVLQVLSVLDAEEGKFTDAMARIDHAISVEPDNLSLQFDKAQLFQQQGHNLEALKIADTLFAAAPTNPDVLALRQTLTAAVGQAGESRRTAKLQQGLNQLKNQALADEIEQTMQLARQMLNSDNLEQARQLYQTILTLEPDYPPALLELGQLQAQQEEFAAARQTLLRGSEHAQRHPQWQMLLIKSEIKLKLFDEAKARCRSAIAENKDAAFSLQLMNVYLLENNWIEANKLAESLYRDNPSDSNLLYQVARSRFELLKKNHHFTVERLSDCQKIHHKALAILEGKQHQTIDKQLAELNWYAGDIDDAQTRLERLVASSPDDHELRFNLSFVYRTQQNWPAFYRANEAGVECGKRIRYHGDLPRWTPERSSSEAVLVMPEQGVGDELHYYHNLGFVIESVRQVYIGCDPRLVPVLSKSFPDAEVFAVSRKEGEDINLPAHVLSDIDSWIAAGSLEMLSYQSTGKHLYQTSYITPPSEVQSHWQATLDAVRQTKPNAPLIGLCWRSGLAAATRNMHYLVVEEIAELLRAMPDAIFVNLQYGECSKELKKLKKLTGIDVLQLPDLDLRDDFVATSAVISGLDAVITAGTAVHRLTVATGTPCYVFFAGRQDADETVAQPLWGDREFGFFYPPMKEDKSALLSTIAQTVTSHLSNCD